MLWTIPNILTMFRVAAAPVIGLLFVIWPQGAAPWAFALFVIAALTDFLDGFIARKFNMGSAFGKMLDPIADKVMVVIMAAVLMGQVGLDPVLMIPFLAILSREVLVSGLREYLGAVKLDVTKLAKWKTTAQLVAIGTLLAGPALGLAVLWPVGLGLLWIAALLTVISGYDYFRKATPILTGQDEAPK